MNSLDFLSPEELAALTVRFWSMVNVTANEEDCWEWTGTPNAFGYGRIAFGGHNPEYTHRIAYMLAGGDIPDEMLVLHSCDNPACVNPHHLHPGTHQENTQEMVDRQRQARGERSGAAKLTEEQVRKIADDYANSDLTTEEIGRLYGIVGDQVSMIGRGKRWKHVAHTQTHRGHAKGEHSGMAKLTEDKVLEIAELFGTSNLTTAEIGAQYGVSGGVVRHIGTGRAWKHVDRPVYSRGKGWRPREGAA